MLPEILVVALVLAAVLGIGMVRESRRHRRLEAWVRARIGRRLHWPFRPEEHLVPAKSLATELLGRAPVGWAGAVECSGPGGQVWFIECRSTPPGRKSPHWYTLVARHRPDLDETEERWSCRKLKGLISTEMLDREGDLASFQP
jgi:hypothetical protein